MTSANKSVLNNVILNIVSQSGVINFIDLEEHFINSDFDIVDFSNEIIQMSESVLHIDENDNVCIR